ncbi:MAG: RNA methyltransferase [Desulfobacterota bacterium]|nr:RNA methyltransferase [Thermodesulfobacteriota bacterium]
MDTQPRFISIIASADNHTFKALRRTAEGSMIKKKGTTIVAGAKLVAEAVHRIPRQCLRLIVYEGFQHTDIAQMFARQGRLIVLKKALFREIDIFNTQYALLEIRVPQISAWEMMVYRVGCTLVLPFQDPVNIGTVVRSAVAFGVEHIVLLEEAAHPFHPKSIRASSGAVFSAQFFRGPGLVTLGQHLLRHNVPVFALDMQGTPLQDIVFPRSFLLVAGCEGQGLPRDLNANRIAIPMRGPVESLNAATATALALFYWSMHTQKTA